jgi:Cu/Ag efflux protein CusF
VTPMNDDTAILSALPAGQLPEAEPEQERADGLAEELAHAAPKRWWNRGTVVLAGLVLLAGGFVGGLQVQKNWGTTSTASRFPAGGFGAGAGAGAGAGRYGGGTGRGGAGAYGGGGFGQGTGGTGQGTGATGQTGAAAATAPAATTGTVKLVDGATIYVQTSDGNVVTVNTNGKTSVAAASKAALSSIKAGQKVTVEGATGSDGAVTATSVTAQKK